MKILGAMHIFCPPHPAFAVEVPGRAQPDHRHWRRWVGTLSASPLPFFSNSRIAGQPACLAPVGPPQNTAAPSRGKESAKDPSGDPSQDPSRAFACNSIEQSRHFLRARLSYLVTTWPSFWPYFGFIHLVTTKNWVKMGLVVSDYSKPYQRKKLGKQRFSELFEQV